MYLPKDVVVLLVELFPRLKDYLTNDGRIIVKLQKALYGLKESALLWYNHISKLLSDLNFLPTLEDKCAFVRKNSNGKSDIICLHVDDLLICVHDELEINIIKSHLDQIFPGMKYSTNYENFNYLNLEINRNITQQITTVKLVEYTKQVMSDYNIIKKKSSPSNRRLMNHNNNSASSIDKTTYLSALMKLMYIAKRTRPDILFVCSYLATKIENATSSDFNNIIYCMEYLNNNIEIGLTFTTKIISNIHCFTDASFGIHADGKSHTGIAYALDRHSSPVLCMSKKQKIISESSTEAELIALHTSGKDCVWMSQLILSLGIKIGIAIIYQDNNAAMLLANNGQPIHQRSKSINIKYFKIKERIDDKSIVLQRLSTEEMSADILTKPIAGKLFLKLRKLLLNREY